MSSLIISAIGSDRPGIVSELSGVITSHGGNVEESRMSRLGADFAIIMLVSVAPNWMESLSVALKSINELTIISKTTKTKESEEGIQFQIDLNGADNEGIVKVLSKYLSEKSINILDLQTNISNAPITGSPLFNLRAILAISEICNISDIQSELNQISQKLGVEIIVTQSESILDTETPS